MLREISEALRDSFVNHTTGLDWIEAVYGSGKGPRPIETKLTKDVIRFFGGIAEIDCSRRIKEFPLPDELDSALEEIGDGTEGYRKSSNRRIDGYFPQWNCFWEAKVAKIDIEQGNRGGDSTYDIGQWSGDIVRLWTLADYLEQSEQVFSLVLISKNPITDWVRALKNKILVELKNDLDREQSKFACEDKWRKRQLRTLIATLLLDPIHLHVIPEERWAVVSLSVADLAQLFSPEFERA